MKLITILLIAMTSIPLDAQTILMPIWPNEIPNQRPTEESEIQETTDILRISNVQNPTIEVFLPPKELATGQAALICPGGGYALLSYEREGTDVAKLLNAHGIAGIVLKNRLPKSKSNIVPHKSALMDAQEAMKTVRKNASKWNINTKQIGVIGFSAGGHLASTLGTHSDSDPNSKPNFMALIYPVISMDTSITHMGSRNNLLGQNPTAELVKMYSSELQITPNTPPTFLIHTTDDGAVPVENSLRFYEGLKSQSIPVEMHIYPIGGHGFGLAEDRGNLANWSKIMIDWMKTL
ncbi:MAG: alpha/beta hydrolase [Cyclobacteriaceae bacterium]